MIREDIVLATLHRRTALTSRWLQPGTPAAAWAVGGGTRRVTFLPPRFSLPPDSCITTWRSDSVVALLSNPVATAADTSPRISTQSAKSAAADCLISIYSCDVSSPPPLCSWITFRLYCTVLRKEEKKKKKKREKGKKNRKTGERAACVRELSGGCHVGLLCSAYTRPPHECISPKDEKKKKKYICVNVCMGFYSSALVQDFKYPSTALMT